MGDNRSSDNAHANWILGYFERLPDVNPIFVPGSASFNCPLLGNVQWDELGILNPAVVAKDDKVFCIYRAAGRDGFVSGVSRLGLAWSDDDTVVRRRLPALPLGWLRFTV